MKTTEKPEIEPCNLQFDLETRSLKVGQIECSVPLVIFKEVFALYVQHQERRAEDLVDILKELTSRSFFGSSTGYFHVPQDSMKKAHAILSKIGGGE